MVAFVVIARANRMTDLPSRPLCAHNTARRPARVFGSEIFSVICLSLELRHCPTSFETPKRLVVVAQAFNLRVHAAAARALRVARGDG